VSVSEPASQMNGPASSERAVAARVAQGGDTLAELTAGSEPVGRVGRVRAGDIPEFNL